MNDYPWLNMPSTNKVVLADDGVFPNSILPLLIYKNAFTPSIAGSADIIQQVFRANGWTNSWQGGIYHQHHYHSNTHEVIGICSGECILLLGGPCGEVFTATKGDVLIIPAGVAHKNLKASDDFLCTAAYPQGKSFDLYYGKQGERPLTDNNIKNVNLPASDPLFGVHGSLFDYWHHPANKPEYIKELHSDHEAF